LELEALLAETAESPPCGPNLEHDLAFFDLEDAARGKPEQRIGDLVKPGEDPNWSRVLELAQGLLLRSKDLRVALYLTRALTWTDGVAGFATGLALVRGLVERYWDNVHPVLEADQGDDPTERVNALASLADAETILRDLRSTDLVNSREHGRLQAREVEIALGRLTPTASALPANPKTLGQIHAQMAAAFGKDDTVPRRLRACREDLRGLETILVERVGGDRAPDLKPLFQSLESLLEACEAVVRPADAGQASVTSQGGTVAVGTDSAAAGEIGSRQQALRALDLVCAYLERHEPTNPAPLFIRRAQRLMTKNFVEIVRDLLPDSLTNLERLAGELEAKEQKT
jgi:type VI secretion system protein ImpA